MTIGFMRDMKSKAKTPAALVRCAVTLAMNPDADEKELREVLAWWEWEPSLIEAFIRQWKTELDRVEVTWKQ